ncbi:MAG: helix-turn-helix domain-containing protein [archaeon]
MIKQEILAQCGLTKNEAKVYLSLLRLGIGTATEIMKQSGVHRVNVYDVLERLRHKGLLSTVMQSNKRVYEAANPNQLVELIHEKEVLLTKILPELEQEHSLKRKRQQLHHFFGPEGVMRAYYMMLEQGKMIYALGGSGLNRQYLKHRHEMWNKERIQRGIKGKALYFEFTKKDTETRWDDPSIQIKYIPDKYKCLGMIDICGDLVINLVPLEGNIMAIVIENKTIADSYRQLFNFMWEHAEA